LIVDYGSTSHQTHRSYWAWIFTGRTNSIEALKKDKVLKIRLQSYQVHVTVAIIQHICSVKNKWIYAQWSGPSETTPNPEVWKNCSSNCQDTTDVEFEQGRTNEKSHTTAGMEPRVYKNTFEQIVIDW